MDYGDFYLKAVYHHHHTWEQSLALGGSCYIKKKLIQEVGTNPRGRKKRTAKFIHPNISVL